MKSWLVVVFIIVAIAGALYSIAWFVAIPKTARALVPLKWNTVVAGERREDYYHYIGSSFAIDSSQGRDKDTWKLQKNNFTFYLKIEYDSDKLAKVCSLQYHFHNMLFDRTETLATDSLQ